MGGRGVPVDPTRAEWQTADYKAGDVLFFTTLTIYKALPNLTPDGMRFSTDNRYQRPEEDIDPSALMPHFNLS